MFADEFLNSFAFLLPISDILISVEKSARSSLEEHTQIGEGKKAKCFPVCNGGKICNIFPSFAVLAEEESWKLYDRESRHIWLDLLRWGTRRNWILNSESLLWCVFTLEEIRNIRMQKITFLPIISIKKRKKILVHIKVDRKPQNFSLWNISE